MSYYIQWYSNYRGKCPFKTGTGSQYVVPIRNYTNVFISIIKTVRWIEESLLLPLVEEAGHNLI